MKFNLICHRTSTGIRFTEVFIQAILLAGILCGSARAQTNERVVTTGVPFLLLGPDARTGGVAEAATGLTPDANALHINAAKVLFAAPAGVSLSYTPWMRQLVEDANYGYLSAYRHMNDREALGVSLHYLNLGAIDFRDEDANLMQSYKAYEFAFSAGYMRKFSEHFGMALTARFVYSDLGNGNYNGLEQKPAAGFAADLSIYREQSWSSSSQRYSDLRKGSSPQEGGAEPAENREAYTRRLAWGVAITNIGTKLSYNGSQKVFLPMNLRAGIGYSFYADPENRLTLLMDINKLLIPTPPRYGPNGEILDGKNPDRSVVSAFFSSLADAPGGFSEEFREFSFSAGLEYSYFNQFFFRSGYFYEDPRKGNRQHFAIGAGLRINAFCIDMAYLAPTAERFPLKNTAKFTISYRPERQ